MEGEREREGDGDKESKPLISLSRQHLLRVPLGMETRTIPKRHFGFAAAVVVASYRRGVTVSRIFTLMLRFEILKVALAALFDFTEAGRGSTFLSGGR